MQVYPNQTMGKLIGSAFNCDTWCVALLLSKPFSWLN